ncbi:MAG: hypothetical protein QW400_00065 [Candidatus Diapherotrites archaeon]
MVTKTTLLIFILLAFFLAGAYSDETKVISASIYYDINFLNVELVEIKAIYGYVSVEEFPGNATLFLLAGDGQELYKGRFGFIEPILVVSPPRADINYNANAGTGVIYPNDTIKQIFLPYFEDAAKIRIVFDINKEIVFDIKERLCNRNGICDKEESTISCSDCKPNEKDGVCVAHNDGVCDPDCLIGVDSDCLKIPPKATPTMQETTSTSPIGRKDEQGLGILPYVFIAVALLVVFAFIYLKRIKGD